MEKAIALKDLTEETDINTDHSKRTPSKTAEEIQRDRHFVTWRTLFSLLSYFVQIPKLSHLEKNLTIHNIVILATRTISKLRSPTPPVLKCFVSTIEHDDLKRFIEYINKPTHDAPNEDMLDILIGSDPEKPIPFIIMEFVFTILQKTSNTLKHWTLVRHDFKNKSHYKHLLRQVHQDETLKTLIHYKIIDTSTPADSILFEAFRGDLLRICAKQSKLSYIMTRINTPVNHANWNFSKSEDDTAIRFLINVPTTGCDLTIENVYPVGRDDILDALIEPHAFDIDVTESNNTYILDNADDSIASIYRLSVVSHAENILHQHISLFTMVSKEEDIQVTKADNTLTIIINKS